MPEAEAGRPTATTLAEEGSTTIKATDRSHSDTNRYASYEQVYELRTSMRVTIADTTKMVENALAEVACFWKEMSTIL